MSGPMRCWNCQQLLPAPNAPHVCTVTVRQDGGDYHAGAGALDNAMQAIADLQARVARLAAERDVLRAALEENEFVDTEIGMICIVCQRDPERLRTGVHESDCWLDAALKGVS